MHGQARDGGVGEEVGQRVVTVQAEADDQPPSCGQMEPHPAQHLDPSAGRDEGDDVAGAEDDVEGLGDSDRREVEFTEVLDQPGRPRPEGSGVGDQFVVTVDPDDGVPLGMEPRRMAPEATDQSDR